MRGKRVITLLCAAAVAAAIVPFFRAEALAAGTMTTSTLSDLQAQIDQKNAELHGIQVQRDALAAQLSSINQSKTSLSKDVQALTNGVNNLNLQIKQNQVTVQKLTLQMQSDSQDIATIGAEIDDHHAAIGKLMVEMQQQEEPGLITLILKKGNLSDSVAAAQNTTLLNQAFYQNISDLQDLRDALSQKITDANALKDQKQAQQASLANQQSILSAQQSEKQDLLDQTKGQEAIYQKLIAQLDEQQAAISQEIGAAEDELRASFNPNLLPSKLPGLISFPVGSPIITQLYGATAYAKKAYSNHFHNGVDLGVPIGTPVYAAADGTVFQVDNNDRGTSRWKKYQFGKYIMIDHADNLTTLYAHLSRQVVKEGETVKKGQLIGYSGATGYADGPHVHFGLYWTPSIELKTIYPAAGLVPVGVTVDPMEYLPRSVATIQRGAY